MAINDTFNYTSVLEGPAHLGYAVYSVDLETAEAKARATFSTRAAAETYAAADYAGPGRGIFVERRRDGFVTWTSF